MTTTMIEQIAAIINPVRVMKVADWMKIAAEILGAAVNKYDAKAIDLLSRYESLTSQPLTKEMFVCDVEKPKEYEYYEIFYENSKMAKEKYSEELGKYQAAQSNLWFEGFEKTFEHKVENNTDSIKNFVELYDRKWDENNWMNKVEKVVRYDFGENITVCFYYPLLVVGLRIGAEYVYVNNANVSDLITEISRYNRTASKPVEINFSENFIRELLK